MMYDVGLDLSGGGDPDSAYLLNEIAQWENTVLIT